MSQTPAQELDAAAERLRRNPQAPLPPRAVQALAGLLSKGVRFAHFLTEHGDPVGAEGRLDVAVARAILDEPERPTGGEGRLTVDTITSDQLDALQDERDTLRQQLDAAHRRFDSLDAVVYSCGPHIPKLTAAHVTSAMERAATERARQAAAGHERAAEWVAANSSPHPAEAAVERVRALHFARPNGTCAARCYTTGMAPERWPCPTIAALDEPLER